MKELIIKVLEQIQFVARYVNLCNSFKDYDSGATFKKSQIQAVINNCNRELNYSSKDKSFFQDFDLGDMNVRFLFTYKYGYIEAFYTILNKSTDERVRGRFNSIAKLNDEDFNEKVSHNFPVATDEKDLDLILRGIIELNSDFITKLKGIL